MTPCGDFLRDFLIRFNRFDYVFDSTDFRPPGDLETRGFRSVPFRLLPAFVILGDEDIASEVRSQRFIISDLSDIFISDIFMASIDWLGTYLLDLLGTLDFLSLVYFLSTFLVSTWLGTFLV